MARIVIATRKQKALSVSLPFNIKAITKGGNNMENLIWKPVVGYEGLYEVSNTGLVRSLNNLKGRMLKLTKRKDGYLGVCLYKHCKQETKTVHRLVAETFIPNPNNLKVINHKDENRSNNNVENLEWCTYSYNTTYSMDIHPERRKVNADNLEKYSPRNKKGVPHKYNEKVAVVDENENVVSVYENAATAAKELKLQTCNVLEVCRTNKKRQIGKKRRTGGYIFEFIEE